MNKRVNEIVGKITINACYALIGNVHKGRNPFQRLSCFFMSKMGLSYYPIESLSSYKVRYGIKKRELLVDNRYGVSSVSADLRREESSISELIKLPDIFLSEFCDISFTGDSDILVDIKNECVINDYCYGLDDSVLFVDGLLYRHKKNHCVLRNSFVSEPHLIECGIMASGKFSKNYFHTLYENLDRLSLLNRCDLPADVPVLVDEKVVNTPSMYEMLRCLIGDQRAIITLKKDALYSCRHLYYIDHIHQIIPHLLKSSDSLKCRVCYDKDIMLSYRDLFLKSMSTLQTPKRVFLSRAKTTHRNYNEDEIFDILVKYGFIKIDCAEYSFYDQIAIFNNAEFIVGGSGAAFSNIIFAKPGTNILCFRSVRGEGTPLFKTIAEIVGCHYYQYDSDSKIANKDIHAGYYINPGDFEFELKKLIQ